MSDSTNSWQAENHPLKITYGRQVMESIGETALTGLKKIPRRGLEIGGVLFGRHEGNDVEIVEWREITCEHARGPAFLLSDQDEQGLRCLLDDYSSDPDLTGLQPVGWFRSRTKGDVVLDLADADLTDRFFPQPWQVVLMLCPHADEPAKAGFFVRPEGGSLSPGASPKEFTLGSAHRRLPAGFDPTKPPTLSGEVDVPPPPAPVDAPRRRRSRESAFPVALVTEEPLSSVEGKAGLSPKAKKVLWAVLGAVAVLAVILVLPATDSQRPENLAPQVHDVNGQLLLEWNRDASAAILATSGQLEIVDGDERTQISLSVEEIRGGSLTYLRRSDEVEFQFSLHFPTGEVVTEFTRYLGADGSDESAPPTPAVDGGDSLNSDLDQLRAELDKESRRAEELRSEIEAEKKKLGIGGQ